MTDNLVLDAQSTIAWLGCQHSSEKQQRMTRKVFKAIESGAQIVAPELWLLEVTQLLQQLVQKDIIDELKQEQFLQALKQLPISISAQGSMDLMSICSTAMHEFKLSAYEACYLNVALKNKARIVSFDSALARAATKLKIRF